MHTLGTPLLKDSDPIFVIIKNVYLLPDPIYLSLRLLVVTTHKCQQFICRVTTDWTEAPHWPGIKCTSRSDSGFLQQRNEHLK